MNLYYKISENDNYNTVKDVLISYFKISHRLLIKLKNVQAIFLNNSYVSVNTKVTIGDVIEVSCDYDEDNSNIVPLNMKLDMAQEMVNTLKHILKRRTNEEYYNFQLSNMGNKDRDKDRLEGAF